MASSTRIHSPHILATLPRPLDHTKRQITARPVLGLRKGDDGVKRPRKRKEVVAGVDGEAVSIYDVSTSRLITSYPIPPQESFSCSPYSIRIPLAGKGVARYTFASTTDSAAKKLTLFKDVVDAAGKTVSTTVHQSLPGAANLVHIELLLSSVGGQLGSLVTVCSTGIVACFDAESLSKVWSESSVGMLRDSATDPKDEYRICFATATTTPEDSEWLSSLQDSRAATQPHGLVLALMASCVQEDSEKRYIIVLGTDSTAAITGQRLAPLQIAPITCPPERGVSRKKQQPSYRVDLTSGQLLEVMGGHLLVYNLSATVPKLASVLPQNARTAIPLSPQTVLICNNESATIYNHVYRWTQAQAPINLSGVAEGSCARTCTLVGYFSQLDVAVALFDNNLVSIPIEASQRGSRKRRFDGRLIDAIGQGETSKPAASGAADIRARIRKARKLFESGKFSKFEQMLAREFGVTVTTKMPQVEEKADTDEKDTDKKGDTEKGDADKKDTGKGDTDKVEDDAQVLQWQWQQYPSQYQEAELLWVWYTIGCALSVGGGGDDRVVLSTSLPSDNIFTYLIAAGHLTLANVRKGLKAQLAEVEVSDGDLSQELVRIIIDVDPTMQLLVTYIAATHLGAPELLVAVKTFMDSLGVAERMSAKLLANEPHDDQVADGDVDEMDIDQLENELAAAEFYFTESETNMRGRGLTLALAKLVSCPTATTVQAIRKIFHTDQILSLILVLRQELVNGAWTTRYIEQSFFEEHGIEPPPDGNVSLIATLLSRCLDAVGPRAWFLNDDVTLGDRTEAGSFLERLGIDVRAALEGLQEAVYLNNILGEVVRFAATAPQPPTPSSNKRTTHHGQKRDIQEMHIESREAHILPLGVPKQQKIEKVRVADDGGVTPRSIRQFALLKSKRVGQYSLERLFI